MTRRTLHSCLMALLLATTTAIPATPANAAEPLWREIEPQQLAFMQLQEGLVVIELNPRFAPKTTAQFRKLVSEGFYDGLSFYRVIDGFVAQGGDGSDLGEYSEVPLIEAEFEIAWPEEIEYVRAQSPDLFAPETGFVDGFAVGRDTAGDTAWLTHCPGVVAMARNGEPDSSRTDFYIVIGQAPRYLDRNMNVFGRVVHGMDAVQRIRRGEPGDNGIIDDDMARSRIRSIRLGSDIPEEERLRVLVPDSTGAPFESYLNSRRNRKEDFFHQRPPQVLDVCQVPMAGRATR